MHPPNHRPTETFLGSMYVREDLLRQEAHNSRVVRWVRTIARVALVLFAVGIVAAILVGPGVAIGWVGTHLIPRLGRPEEIAKLVCFLVSDDASWITGSVYLIDGGSLAWRGANA